MRRVLSLILLVLVLLAGSTCSFAAGGLDNFKDVNRYEDGMFSDVGASDWFSTYVENAYRKNLMVGSGGRFNAEGSVSVAETITIASKLHAIYRTGSAEMEPADGPWYQAYVEYAERNGIVRGKYDDCSRAATRAEFVSILANAFPGEAFPETGDVPDGAVPDVPMDAEYADAVYTMYRAGIIAGSDAKGTFNPSSGVRRSEVATILAKMVDTGLRSAVRLGGPEGVIPDDSTFEIRFIDVGQGDASLVLCDGHAMLIDGGDSSCSSLMYTVLRDSGISRLDCVVATHPDADHVGGLSGALNFAAADRALCTTDEHDTSAFRNFRNCLARQGVAIDVPKAGDSFYLGSAKVTVLASTDGKLTDNTSIVLRIEYGETSFLFTGDAERDDEKALIDSGAQLGSTVLKVAHHGSSDATGYQFLYYVNPQYSVISVGGDNGYGHPTEDVLSRLRDQGCRLFRTDMNGDIICRSDSHDVTFTVTRNPSADTFSYEGGYSGSHAHQDADVDEPAREQPEGTATYVVNLNTGKFHEESCPSVKQMAERNRLLYTGTRDWLIQNGYEPCMNCNP